MGNFMVGSYRIVGWKFNLFNKYTQPGAQNKYLVPKKF